MKNVYVVRHGQTYWNKESSKKHQTHSNGSGNNLTEDGVNQAKSLGKKLSGVKFDKIYVSPMNRAVDTYELMNENLSHTGKVYILDELTEMSMAFLDGMTKDEWIQAVPETAQLYEDRSQNKYGCKIPEYLDFTKAYEIAKGIKEENNDLSPIPPWENYADVCKRVEGLTDSIKKSDLENILVIAHQGTNRAVIGNLLDDQINTTNFKIPQGTYGVVTLQDTPQGQQAKYYPTEEEYMSREE